MAFSHKGYLERISGKTGTAQTAASNNIDIENTCWFAAITPREDPEIAIVVFIPNGLSGSSGAVAIEDIVTYWYERREAEAAQNEAAQNTEPQDGETDSKTEGEDAT
jgi:penicillin-binding protein 2